MNDGNNRCPQCQGCQRRHARGQTRNNTPYRTDKERVWDTIRTFNAPFAVADVTPEGVAVHVARQVVKSLALAGIVTKSDKQTAFGKGKKPAYYTLSLDMGHELPRIDKHGKVKPATTFEQMWRTLKIIPNITPDQLAAMSSTPDVPVSVRTANFYLQQLNKAGYVAVSNKATHARKASYQLVKNTGAKPPQVLKTRVVYDPNTNQTVHQQCVCDAYEEAVA